MRKRRASILVKTLPLCAVATLGLVTAGHANQVKSLDDGLLGDWCLEVQTSTENVAVYKRGFCRDSARWMTLTSVRQIGHEFGCNISRVARNRTYPIDMKCAAEGMRWKVHNIRTLRRLYHTPSP